MEAVISENFKGAPKITYNGDTLEICFIVYTDDFNKYKELWKNETKFEIKEKQK